MKFREERSILGLGLSSGNFHDRYFILSSSNLRMYREIRVRVTAANTTKVFIMWLKWFHFFVLICSVLSLCQSNRPDREWPTKNLKVYNGIKKKLRAPTWWENISSYRKMLKGVPVWNKGENQKMQVKYHHFFSLLVTFDLSAAWCWTSVESFNFVHLYFHFSFIFFGYNIPFKTTGLVFLHGTVLHLLDLFRDLIHVYIFFYMKNATKTFLFFVASNHRNV